MPFPTNMPGSLDTFVDGVDTYHADIINALSKITVGPTMVNLRGQGADNTGATAIDTAWTAAVAALPTGGGDIFAPPGTYKFVSPIAPGATKHIHLIGTGRDLDNTSSPPTVFSYQPAGAGTTAMTFAAHASIVENILLIQGNAQATTNLLTASGSFSGHVRDVTVMNATGNGVSLLATGSASCIEWSFDRLRSVGNNIGCLIQGNLGASKTSNSHLFLGGEIVNNTTNNVKIITISSDNTFLGTDVTGTGGSMVNVVVGDGTSGAGTIRGNAFINIDCENGGTGFSLGTDSTMTFIHGNITAVTPLTAGAGASYWFFDTHNNKSSKIGTVGLNYDAAGNLGVAGAAPTATGINVSNGAGYFNAASTVFTTQASAPRLQVFAGVQVSGVALMSNDLRRSRQTPTETVLVSGVDATLGELVSVTLTAARVVGAPLNPAIGQRLLFILTQGGAGGFAVTWNAVFKKTWADTGNTTGKISSIAFAYDGTNWVQDGAQAAYV